MRWGDGEFHWIRPIRGIVCLLSEGEQTRDVPFRFAGHDAARETCGHPLIDFEKVEVKSVRQYEGQLEKASVILSRRKRYKKLTEDLRNCERQLKKASVILSRGTDIQPLDPELFADEELLQEVVGMVEWPTVIIGRDVAPPISIPFEIAHQAMRVHQKIFWFVTADAHGRLNYKDFAAVVDCKIESVAADDQETIKAGIENVVRARLHDAGFFWKKDASTGLKIVGRRAFGARLSSVAWQHEGSHNPNRRLA